ncbi:thioredoxin family protein [Pedobacter panaciterrae]|uniref:Thioredoxin family protein n=1 Tax=Pedobacter panaciterrae TaxID=363849 RepID=A0ABU8NHF7_9SPHI
MKHQFYLTAFFSLFLTSVTAQTTKEIVKSDDVVIEGTLTDPLIASSPNQKATVTIRISTFATTADGFPATNYVQEVSADRKFKFVIPAPSSRFYMDIYFEPAKDKYWAFLDNIYILEKGDRIKCNLSSDYFEFSGKGSAKLNCQSAINKHQYHPKTVINEVNVSENSKEIEDNKLDSILNLRLAVVNKYAPTLGNEMTDIMIANCYGMRYFLWLRTGYITSQTAQKFLNFTATTAYKKIDFSLNQKMKPDFLVASPIYCDFLFQKICVESLRYNDWKTARSEERNRYMFKTIKDNYTGIIREKLLTIFFLKARNSFPWLQEALPIIKDDFYKKLLTHLQRTNADGLPFYPFELENSKGNVVKLTDFKDKVIILDFWFTGCSPCKKLNEAMKPVIDRYKGNPNVEFVSISIDANKSTWLRSIKTGEYTHELSVNLYAGKKNIATGGTNPLISNYNVTSYPKLFIVKEGKMYSSNPPVPLLLDEKNPSKGNTRKLIELIDKALKIENR